MEWQDCPVSLRAWVDCMDLDLRAAEMAIPTITPVEALTLHIRGKAYLDAFGAMAYIAGAAAVYVRGGSEATAVGDRLGLDLLQRAWHPVLCSPGGIGGDLALLAGTQLQPSLDARHGVTAQRVRPPDIAKVLLELYPDLRGPGETILLHKNATKLLTPSPVVGINN